MKFYNRAAELSQLRKAVLRKPNFILIRGRRRVGKTALILQLISENNGIYLYVDDKKNEPELLREFSEVLRDSLSLPDYVRIEKWEQLYEIIFSHEKLVAIDEFQRLLSVNPSAITQLQNYWDKKGQGSKAVLILSGSNVGVMKRIFEDEKAPLFKRATNDLMLRPMRFQDTQEILNDLGIRNILEQMKVYSVFGGIPYYYALLQNSGAKTWQDCIKETVLNQLSPLKTEIRDTMVESFGKDHPSYYAVVNAIALGKTTKKEIADFSGILETSISPYLYDLENLVDVIQYEVPATEKKPWKSRLGRFVLKDNFFRFWFRFIFRNMSHYEQGNYDHILKLITEDFDSFMGPCFEKLAAEFIMTLGNNGQLPFALNRMGRWWSRKGDDIDFILFTDDLDEVVLVECKWDKSADARAILAKMSEKSRIAVQQYNTVRYMIIARGFKTKTDNALCFDLKDIEKAFS